VQFLLATLEQRKARVEPCLDQDQVFVSQRSDPRRIDAFGYDSHLDLLNRRDMADRPASTPFFSENDNAPPDHLSSGAHV
jgi:hypothetical protein